ncbi:hypothetical protein RhiirA1_465250 [Rhizophagus irregularis]|uniref:Uncharacterized protein n=1 Tax=Rhizophagus irregularis TaxID=588596 RepID=A0A2N0RGC7_9GLOM|nr:hypothetical protein RhiirA1_465250 [Rhizophagus irregularis]
MGRIDNFWLKSLLRLKHHNVAVNKKINAENVFLSCDLTCDGIQIGGSSNVIRGNKRSYENCKQSGNEETKNIRLWSHAIDSVVINNASENDWTTQDLHRFLLESTN